ncbi:hypothetical protein [Streptomyces sp. SID3343]|uniref:hypothetical protein n=1 Tax=Streptomyces sp. SID3343 TaxID=2690260 RepID=UPI00136EAE1B|nr:hypothetical protein [Streptomyces sp. SID3343]MYW05763.1 hypothetical protein [Streptomyces sp. SID3343]
MNETENTGDQPLPEQNPAMPAESPSDAPIAAEGTPGPEVDRRELEEAHSRLDAANKRIDAMLRREVERQAGERLVCGADLFDLGKQELSALLNESGCVDDAKVGTALDALLKARPYLSSAPSTIWGVIGPGPGSISSDDEDSYDTPDWNSALSGRRDY